jgi:hypothetical protein
LIKIKHNEYLVAHTTIKPKEKFESIVYKWKKITTNRNNVDCNNDGHKRNGLTCKDKWGPYMVVSNTYLII